ncbi:MAG: hypothetical protein U0236_17375 [Nitrospira sp.]
MPPVPLASKGKARSVQPNVDALDEVLCHMHFVIFKECDATTELVIVAERQHFMDEVPAWLIGWMGLAGKNQLDWSPSVLKQCLEPLEVSEEQGRSLVGCKPASKPDRKGLWVHHCPARA